MHSIWSASFQKIENPFLVSSRVRGACAWMGSEHPPKLRLAPRQDVMWQSRHASDCSVMVIRSWGPSAGAGPAAVGSRPPCCAAGSPALPACTAVQQSAARQTPAPPPPSPRPPPPQRPQKWRLGVSDSEWVSKWTKETKLGREERE